jgi:RecB family exonuclease
MSLTLQDLRGLPHTSVSQLKTFLQCPRKYRYQYIDRIRPEFRPIALAFGTAWHHAIGEYLLPQVKDRVPTREEIQAVFRDSLTEEVQADGIPACSGW